jgi:hypothetical protein
MGIREQHFNFSIHDFIRTGILTKVNAFDTQNLQALRAGLFAILRRAVGAELERLVCFDISKFRCKKDLITLSRAFEPFAKKFLTVTVQAVVMFSKCPRLLWRRLTQNCPKMLSLIRRHDRGT